MEDKPVKIKFKNAQNPKSAFDLIKLEDLFRRKYDDHHPENLHKVEFFILMLITEGSGKHKIDFTDHAYEKGTLLTIKKDQIHQFYIAPHTKGYLLLFTDDFLISYLEKLEVEKSFQLFNDSLGVPKIQLQHDDYEVIRELIERMGAEYFQEMDDYSLGIIRSELQILITKLFRIKSKSNQTLWDKKYLSQFISFQERVEENESKNLRVADYSDTLGISSKTLNTITQSIVGKSAKEFIDEVSIKQIKRLLINTSLSIKEIAYNSGFEETTNFFKYFKRHVGMTPEQFRASF